MGQTLLHKRSGDIINGQPKLPTAEDLKHGEIAINYADGAERISFKNSNNEIVSLRTDDFYEGEFDKLAKADSDLDSKINAVDKSAYKKPVNGIPFEDLASAVQASLNMADTAIQPNTLANYDFINRIQLGVELNKLETAIDTKTDDKIDDVLAIVTENEQVAANALTNLDNRTKALEEATVEVDTQLSMTSQMPVANATITAELNKKIDADDAVALADFNTAMAGKQDKIDNLNEIIAGAALGKTALQPSSLDSYITDGEVNTLLDKKADKSDVPTESIIADWGFTKNEGTVTGVKMNGNTMSMSNGVVNLGTVITNVDNLAIKTEVNTNIAKAKDDAIEYADEVKGDIIAIIEEGEKVTANSLTELDERVSAIEGGSVTIEVDSEMSTSSTNPLQNATVTSVINKINSDIVEIEGLLSNKQETITDLATIRSGAAAGATAVQPAALSAYTTTAALNEAISKIDIPDATDIANMGFTKNEGTVTGVKMNNASVTVGSDGVVNLGTVLTNDSNYAKADAMENALAKKSDTGHTHNYLPLAGGEMANTTVVKNLNADLLDGKNASAFATSDHNHDSVYYKISTAETALAKKSDTGHTHSQYSGTGHTHDDRYSLTGHTHPYAASAHTHDDRYYTESEVNGLLTKKSDVGHSHDVATTAVTGFVQISNADVNTTAYEDGVAAGMDHSHSNYSVTGHTHDDRYFTETEVNSALAKKSDTGHTHSYLPLAGGKMDNTTVVTNLNADLLDGKNASAFATSDHNHDSVYYKISTAETALAKKSDTGHTHNAATTAVTGFVKISNGDVASVAHADGLVAGMDHSHSNYSTTGHNHDSVYYKISTAEAALAKKSDTGHTHNYLPLAGGEMANTTVVKNLNADLLDGKNASAFATSDHNHDSVYYKISDAEAALAKKVDQSTFDTLVGGDASGAIDTFNEITSFLSGITATGDTLQETIAEFETQVNSKSDKNHNHDSVYYKITAAEAALAKKSDTGHTHSQYSGTGHTHDDRYSLTGHTHPYAASAHTHDDRYFTESEVNGLLAKKSDTGHTHSTATTAVTGFVKISNGDVASVSHADGLVAGMDHSHSNYSVTGHTHDDRYLTETEVNTALAKKSDTGHTHSQYSGTGHTHDDRYSLTGHTHPYAASAHTHDDRYFTETEVNSALAKKSDTGHTHSAATTAVTGFVKISNGDVATVAHADGLAAGMDHSHGNYSVTGHTHDDRYLTETEVNTALAKKSDTGHTHSQYSGTGHTHDDRYSLTGHTHSYSPTGHTHDDRYYTESEVNDLLAKKSDTGHTHSAATTAVTGFVKISNGDVASVAHANGLVAGMDHSHSNYSVTGHTHDDRYFTETEVNSALAKKSDTGHTHSYAGSSSAGGAATSALKLSNARTLWGQSFNGEGNISGNITSTGNITPSSNAASTLGTSSLKYKDAYVSNSINLGGATLKYNATTGCLEIVS